MSDQTPTAVGDTHAVSTSPSAPLATFLVSPQGMLLEANAAMVGMLGLGLDATVADVDFFDGVLTDPKDRDHFQADAVRAGAAQWSEQTWRRADGRTFQARVAVRGVRGPQGELVHLEGFAEDMTERRRLDEITRRDERMAMLGRTLSGVAHEINNPLAAIIGFAQILLKTEQTPPNRHALETVLSEARRAARIVKDLRTLARRQEPSSRSTVDLPSMARTIVAGLRSEMQRHAIRTDIDAAGHAAMVYGDPVQLEQVVRHLMVNAIQSLETRATRERADATSSYAPRLTVRTGVHARSVRVEVCDNGIGIAAKDLPHIWDPFWTNREEGKGTGLGLAVVHGIVAAHDGTIEVRSDAENGTCFTIMLPLAIDSAEPRDAEGVPSGSTPGGIAVRPLDILIVDDEQSLRTLLQRIFTDRGHAVVTADSGAQALRLAEQSPFDVVVCDLRMPTMDGRDVIQRMSALPTCANSRFVLSTGDVAGISPPAPGTGSRIDAVVAKPYNVSLLVEIVEGTATS